MGVGGLLVTTLKQRFRATPWKSVPISSETVVTPLQEAEGCFELVPLPWAFTIWIHNIDTCLPGLSQCGQGTPETAEGRIITKLLVMGSARPSLTPAWCRNVALMTSYRHAVSHTGRDQTCEWSNKTRLHKRAD